MKTKSKVIVESSSGERAHRTRLEQLTDLSNGVIRVASAYVTDREFFLSCGERPCRLLTSLNPMDVASGATSLESLRALLDASVEVRITPNHPRLHAKVYLFGNKTAVVTSANLTRNAFESNLEVGAEV